MPTTQHRTLPVRRTPTVAPLLLVALAAALAASGANAQQAANSGTQVLGLADALRAIAAHSESAIAAGLDLDAAREGTKRLEALYLPSVSLTGSYMARDNPVVAIFGALQAPETERSFLSGELDATYLLWDGGRRFSAVEQARELGARSFKVTGGDPIARPEVVEAVSDVAY
jgi:outer membrane protein TolC